MVIREFFSAVLARETYTPRRNPEILFGLLWGAPIAILALLFHVIAAAPPLGLSTGAWNVVFVVALLHPLFFAVVFGALGTLRQRRTSRMRDLLDRLRQEIDQLERRNTDIRELDRRKDEFLGNVTHELKTPLVTIRGYSDMLRSGRLGDLNSRQTRAVEVMRKSARRLQEQIDRLLAFNSNRGYLGELKWERLPLSRILNDVEEQHDAVAESKGVTLEIGRPESNPVLWGDRERLTEVLDNLLSNAIKFSDEGGRVHLRFEAKSAGVLHGVIEDDGCGIPENALESIFERFRQAHAGVRERYGGSGLGLAIVRSNLDAHGCSIRVESEEGRGARFLFTLPLADGEGPEE